MKETPAQKDQKVKLLPGMLSAEGFLGDDSRSPAEITRDDQAVLERLGLTRQELAGRMRELTEAGKAELGRPVIIDGQVTVSVTDDRGVIPCPFSDNFRAGKQITTVTLLMSGLTLRWSDLNIHMIGEHGFFEGHSSPFRQDPEKLAELLRFTE